MSSVIVTDAIGMILIQLGAFCLGVFLGRTIMGIIIRNHNRRK